MNKDIAMKDEVLTMRRLLNQSILSMAIYVCTSAIYAAPQWYFTFGAGVSMPKIKASDTVNNNSGAIPPLNQDIYTTDASNTPALLLEVGKSWQIPETGLQSLSLGLQYQYFMPSNMGRQVIQYSSPNFTNYSYNLNLEANILLLNARIELFTWKKIAPFINLGAGVLQLTATDYSEQAYSGITARTSPNFARNANYRFTYQAGAGFNWKFTQELFASVSYNYQPLSTFSTKGGSGTWSNRKLAFGDVETQTVFATVTYMLPA